jgi:hypothetical protein
MLCRGLSSCANKRFSSSAPYLIGRPGRGASANPAQRLGAKHRRHLLTRARRQCNCAAMVSFRSPCAASSQQDDLGALGQRARSLMPSAPTFQLLPFGIVQRNHPGFSARAGEPTISSLIKSTNY